MTKPEAQPSCCGVDVRRDYEVSADYKTLYCPDCGKAYTRDSIQAEAQPQGGELLPCPLCKQPLEVMLNGRAVCRNAGSGQSPHDGCLLWLENAQLHMETWQALNTRADLPRPAGETTVEGCLAELREMFPHTFVRVSDVSEYSQNSGLGFHVCGIALGRQVFHADTLADCMAQVRAVTRGKGETK